MVSDHLPVANPQELIWESVCWAVDETEAVVPQPMAVVLNARESRAQTAPDCEKRGGALIERPD